MKANLDNYVLIFDARSLEAFFEANHFKFDQERGRDRGQIFHVKTNSETGKRKIVNTHIDRKTKREKHRETKNNKILAVVVVYSDDSSLNPSEACKLLFENTHIDRKTKREKHRETKNNKNLAIVVFNFYSDVLSMNPSEECKLLFENTHIDRQMKVEKTQTDKT